MINFDPLTLEPLPAETRQRFLRFFFEQHDTALIPLEQITEILRLNLAEILPVPEMPSCILGIYNWRGEILWLIDLNHLVGYSHLASTYSTSLVAMVVQIDDQCLGLVVNQVYDIELHDLQQLQPVSSGLFAPNLMPFVLGALPEEQGTVLDVNAITQCPLWQIHKLAVGSGE